VVVPVVAFVSPKGGVGKTTAATILACQLARQADVVVIDADVNRPVAAWAALQGAPDRLQVVSEGISEETIVDRIEEAAERAPFVIVDCEGSANLTVAYAIGSADLVVVPMGGSQLDAAQAARALQLVKRAEKQGRRTIPHAILMTRTPPVIRSRTLTSIHDSLRQHGVALFDTELNERDAFRAMFSFGGSLDALDPAQVGGLEKARLNARDFAAEVVAMLKGQGAQASAPAREVA
jgi:chromosome partitioning protein